ncbi:MAG: glycoside hydrolase family 3 C-terminal domain-containing protein [Clostridia bacterium]|nr:glycoside hydrolase family 3 C-terminal domain-containing protein [Clostridia bacterium]
MRKTRNQAIDARVDALLEQMTLKEMIMQTDQYFSHDFTRRNELGDVTAVDMEKLDRLLRGFCPGSIQARGMTPEQINEVQRYAIEHTRLHIPILFSEEALHGLCHRAATAFPQQIGLAATFRPDLGRRMGRAIGTEARAMGIHETYSPVMDLIRDPRYGRTEESYGEDTHLCAEFAREVVRGMQGDALDAPDAIAAEPKHYAGYGAPVGGLNCAPCAMGRHEVFSDCLPVFEAAFADGGATDAMCSYNAIDGTPVSADHELLTEVLRDQWGMKGFVRSDLTAVARLYDNHYLTPTRKEAIAMGLEAGVDLQLYDFPHDEWQNGIEELVREGRLDMSTVRRAAGRVLRVKCLLGLFEHPYVDTERQAQFVHNEQHVALAREIALESMTLLKNENRLLPLSKTVGKLAVLGPCAGHAVLGDYTTENKTGVSVLEAVRKTVSPDTQVLYDPGCNILGDALLPFPAGWLTDEEGKPGLTGRYYRGNAFDGTPVMTRNDPAIHFNWIMGKPHGDLDAYCFCVAWTGKLMPDAAFQGWLGFGGQDSMRLYVDGQLILDVWGEKNDADRTVPFAFEAGRVYDLRVAFFSDHRGARVQFGYQKEREDFSRAVALARQADVCILCMGDGPDTCGENLDRVSLDLPGRQEEFVRAVAATGTPVVLVLQTGRPVTAVWEQKHIPAILEAWFPGEEGGWAVAETLFGDHTPSGRLPITFPRHVGQIPCHYSRRPGGGKRYVEMDWLPLYPFGYGLSYTEFAYSDLTLSDKVIAPGDSVTASFTVRNTGERAGAAVPQLYLRDMFASTVKPEMTLAAFEKVFLQPGEEKRVSLTISPKAMRTLDRKFQWHVEPGGFRVFLAENAEKPLMSGDFRVEAASR